MADLVTLSDLKVFLGVTGTTDDTLLTALLDDVEALLEADCGRSLAPFGAAAVKTEYIDGTGSREIFVRYPIASIRSIELGIDTSVPDESLVTSDPTVISFTVGDRRIARVDGGRFGVTGKPRFIKVVYTSTADLPTAARLAVKRGCAIIYRQRGSEDASSESIQGDYSHNLARAREDSIWQGVVSSQRRPVLA